MPKHTPYSELDKFISGEIGLFDWMLAYEQTPAFDREIEAYWHKHKVALDLHRSKRNIYATQWRRSNFIKVNAIGARRYERKRITPNVFTETDWQTCLSYFGHRCAVCGRPQGLWHTISKAHWIPLASPECPGTIPTNIIPLCNGIDGCNNSQLANAPETWLTKRYGKYKATKIIQRVNQYFALMKPRQGVNDTSQKVINGDGQPNSMDGLHGDNLYITGSQRA